MELEELPNYWFIYQATATTATTQIINTPFLISFIFPPPPPFLKVKGIISSAGHPTIVTSLLRSFVYLDKRYIAPKPIEDITLCPQA